MSLKVGEDEHPATLGVNHAGGNIFYTFLTHFEAADENGVLGCFLMK